MDSLKEMLDSGRPVISVEVTPPRGADADEVISRIEKLKGLTDVIDVTYCPMAKLHMGSIPFAHILKHRLDIEVIANVTTRDLNVLGIQSLLLGAHALGIKNLVALKGDVMSIGDFPDAKEVFEINSIELLRIIDNLNHGLDSLGREITGATDFLAGAVINPNASLTKEKILKRIMSREEHNVGYFLTQPVYSSQNILKFKEIVSDVKTPILLGILPIKNRRMVEIVSHLPGVDVPDTLPGKLSGLSDPEIGELSLDYSLEIMEKTKGLFAGFHLMTAGDLKYAKTLIERFKAL